MNKIISTKERVFIPLIGPSGSGKSQLLFCMLKAGVFQPPFDKIFYFYQYHQPLYDQMQKQIKNIEFISCIDFELVENLPIDGTKYLLIFDDSCEEISRSKQFEKIATAGRHKNLHCIYIKHNLFHKSPIGRDAELQNTHLILFKSPRDVQQIKILAKQLGLGKELINWYNDATSKPFGHLLIDLNSRTPDSLRYATDICSFPAKFYLPNGRSRITEINDKGTELLYSETLDRFQADPPENYPIELFQGIY